MAEWTGALIALLRCMWWCRTLRLLLGVGTIRLVRLVGGWWVMLICFEKKIPLADD
jgi:hypothetical protein